MTTQETTLLLRWQRDQDAEAFATLVSRYSGLVYGTCRRMLGNPHDAQDAAQQCFMRLAHADASSISYLGGWLHRVAANLCRDHVKTEVRRRRHERAYAETAPDAVESPWDDLQQHIDEAIEALPEGSRYAIQAHFLEGRTHEDIARELNITRSGVTHRIERGIKQVREALRERGVLVGVPGLMVSMQQHLVEEAPAAVKLALGRLAVAGPSATINGLGAKASSALSLTTMAAGIVGIALVAVAAFALLRDPSETTATQQPLLKANSRLPGASSVAATATASGETPATMMDFPSVKASDANRERLGVNVANAVGLSDSTGLAAAGAASGEETESVTVRCIDTGGHAVAGAEVYLVQVDRRSPPMQFAERPGDMEVFSSGPVTSGSDGIARFHDIPVIHEGARIRFNQDRNAYARMPGKAVGAMARDQTRGQGSNELSVTMVPSIDVRGTVTVPEGFEPNDVNVRIIGFRVLGFLNPQSGKFSYKEELPWKNLFEAVPDDDAAFLIPDLPSDGAVYLAAEAPGLAQAQFAAFETATLGPIEFAMTAEAVIEGRLSFGEDDGPAPGFTVTARPHHGPVTEPFSALTQEDGSFRIEGLSGGRYHVIVPVGEQPSPWNCAVRDVILGEGETLRDIQLVLEEGQMLSGAVRESDSGAPISGVMVVGLYGGMSGEAVASTVTDTDGTFCFRMPGGEALLYLGGIPETYVYPEDQGRKTLRIVPNASEQRDIDFVLARDLKPVERGSATVVGRVIDTDGNPISAVAIFEERIEMHGDQEWQMSGKVADTDGEGFFTYLTRAPCTSSFRVGGLGYRSEKTDAAELRPGDELDIGNLVVERLVGEIAGVVSDADGNPIPGAGISVYASDFTSQPQPIITDADGVFYAQGVPDGDLSIEVAKPGYDRALASVRAGQECSIELKSLKSAE